MIYLLESSQEGSATNWGRYIFDGKEIRLYIADRLIYKEPAKIGDVYDVKEVRGEIYLRKVGIPKNRGGIIAWLLKFNKRNRTSSYVSLQKIKEKECYNCPWNGGICKPTVLKSTGHEIYICDETHNRTGYKSIAAWISDAITKREVLSLVPFMTYYPEELVKYLLSKYFGITDAEFAEAKKNQPKHF